jgi:hypothetical protein
MLTVLWRKPDGGEQIFAAETIHRLQPEGEQCVPARGKFLAHGVTCSGVPADYFEFDIEGPFGAVFVMNATGQTVARYMASPS